MISSLQNPKIQNIRGLLSKRKLRYEQKACVLEGVRLVETALQAGVVPELIVYSQITDRAANLIARAQQEGTEIIEADPRILKSIGDTQTSQGLLAIVPIQPLPFPTDPNLILILDNVRDPGNLGAVLRTASAAGVQLVALAPGTTDPYSPKVLRAAMGSHFFLPIHPLDWEEIEQIKQNHTKPFNIFITDVAEGKSCWETDLKTPLALVIGSEATGTSSSAQSLADHRIHIPMQGKMESLNAAVAAGILIYEIIRQRKS